MSKYHPDVPVGTRLTVFPIHEFGEYFCRFEPVRTDDLKPEMADSIGRAGWFHYLWVIEEGSPYSDQFAMAFPEEWRIKGTASWVPSGDLVTADPSICDCSCHFPPPVMMHFIACCDPCPVCEERIKSDLSAEAHEPYAEVHARYCRGAKKDEAK